MRRTGAVDENQPGIVRDLRALGFSVQPLSAVGGGCPDILVGDPRLAFNWLFEIKNPEKPKADRGLTPDQRKFFAGWRGQVRKVETLDEILEIIREAREERLELIGREKRMRSQSMNIHGCEEVKISVEFNTDISVDPILRVRFVGGDEHDPFDITCFCEADVDVSFEDMR